MTFYGTHPFVAMIGDDQQPTGFCERCGGPRRAHEDPAVPAVPEPVARPEPGLSLMTPAGLVRVLTMADIAAAVGLNVSTVRVHKHQGLLPAPDGQIGNVLYWREESIAAWIRRQTAPKVAAGAGPGDPDMFDACGERVYTMAALAAAAGLSVSTVRVYRSRGRLPVPDGRVGNVPYWRKDTVLPWILKPRRKGNPAWHRGMPGPRGKRPDAPVGPPDV